MKIFKLVLLFIWLFVLFGLVDAEIFSVFDSSSYTYWWVTIGWICFIWNFHHRDLISLKLSLILFMACGLLVAVGWDSIGEVGMRFGFILLLIGSVQSLIEYKKPEKYE